MLTQTVAIFRDAYRELNAKRLFWLVMAMSGLVFGAFATFGLTDDGFTINVLVKKWELPSSVFNLKLMTLEQYYTMMFMSFGVKIWLAWIASILALISTASIVPDFLSGGAIELTLSKPIGRFRLFMTKYLSGLLFVMLQVIVFAGSAFLLIGIRGGSWNWKILLAIPIVTVFFSYIYCISTLFGLLTRSTITSLLLTALVWFGFFGLGKSENLLMAIEIAAQQRVELIQQELDSKQQAIDAVESGELTKGATKAILDRMTLDARKESLLDRRAELAKQRKTYQSWVRWHNGLYIAKTILPKTSETVDLLKRQFKGIDDFQNQSVQIQQADQRQDMTTRKTVQSKDDSQIEHETPSKNVELDDVSVQREMSKALRERSVWWVMGTSLLFEAVVLLFAGLIFVRRDF